MKFLTGLYDALNVIKEMFSLEFIGFIGFMAGLLSPLFILGIIVYFVFMRAD